MAKRGRSLAATWLRALRLLHSRRSFVYASGLMRSFRERRPVDAQGQPLPWINYAAVRLLDERLHPSHTVFEYGAGYSTLFFAARCAAVTAVEHNHAWLEEVRALAPGNVNVLHLEPGEGYWQAAADTGGHFDVVFVDGLHRDRCLPFAERALSAAGVLVLDDSDRPAYQAPLAACGKRGFRSLRLRSFRPGGLTESECALLYRDGNCLGL